MSAYLQYESGITQIDARYIRPGLAAIFLLVENGRAALIETGCNASLPFVLNVLAQQNISPECIDYVIPTHVHLDHAGGVGSMMRVFSNARLVVHPRGARHMIDPSKLVEGATAVYGEEQMGLLYGEILPVDANRVIEATDNLVLHLSDRPLLFLDVPGHARHHVAIVDEKSDHIFTGDSFGLTFSELDGERGRFVYLTTTPVQFEPDAMHTSIDRLLSYQPSGMFVTHFGELRDVERYGDVLHHQIDVFVDIARQHRDQQSRTERHHAIRNALGQFAVAQARAVGCTLAKEKILEILAHDLELNAQGLGVWLDTRDVVAS